MTTQTQAPPTKQESTAPYLFDPNPSIDYLVNRIVRNEVFINAIEGVVEVKVNEAFQGPIFKNAVESIVEHQLDEAFQKFKNEVFDDYMGSILGELQAINNHLTEVDNRLSNLEGK